jgi:hypothetical protein
MASDFRETLCYFGIRRSEFYSLQITDDHDAGLEALAADIPAFGVPAGSAQGMRHMELSSEPFGAFDDGDG